jgi:hypothetical protein
MECPANFEPVESRETGMRAALNGGRANWRISHVARSAINRHNAKMKID